MFMSSGGKWSQTLDGQLIETQIKLSHCDGKLHKTIIRMYVEPFAWINRGEILFIPSLTLKSKYLQRDIGVFHSKPFPQF